MDGTRILAVSDASLGYGSPQIPALMRSLRDYYQSEVSIVEPDETEKPPRHDMFPDLPIRRIVTPFHPHSAPGRIDYVDKVSKEINRERPDILVIICTFNLPILFKLRYRPKFVIYYAIESIVTYGAFDIQMNRHLDGLVDLIIFPEENRAVFDSTRSGGFDGIPKVVMYNSSELDTAEDNSMKSRNGRIISAGTIGSEHTFADYYLDDKLQGYPIDLYGPIVGSQKDYLTESFNRLRGEVTYKGQVDIRELAKVRRSYAYSLVIWSPATERGLYAPSNKFFESILDGVPPITAPHPQHKVLTERYRCGIVMEDWSFEAFYGSIKLATSMYGTAAYHKMVENCRVAVAEELSWEHQFNKLVPFLE